MSSQIDTDNYQALSYDDAGRFLSYYYQIKFIADCMPEKVLEIGVGNKTLINYLRQHKIDASSCDIDEKLDPDFIGDVKNLPLENNTFDVVCAFQILEHIPWDEVSAAINELARVSKKNVIISVPYTPVGMEFIFRSSLLYRLIKKWKISLFINLSMITRPWKFDGSHFWEMGKKNYPRKMVRKLLNTKFRIIKEQRTELSYQYFFVLEKR